MPDLDFQVEAAEPVDFAALPQLAFRLRIRNADPEEEIHSVILGSQIQIEVTRRQYSAREKEQLLDLFAEPHRWEQTLRNLLWTHTQAVAPAFRGDTTIQLRVPCTFDFNVAATKYFHAIEDGEIPLCLQFSGTVFYGAATGLQVAPISWSRETRFRLPVRTWREMMDHYYPNSAWLCLARDTFDRLYQRKVSQGVATWEEMLDGLLAPAKVER